MTHGDEGGKLFGSNGKHIILATVAEIASLFNITVDNYSKLINKPQIAIYHA